MEGKDKAYISIESVQNEEIRKMKNENRLLKEENKKLKVELKKEKNKNEKFRKIAEEMISFYEISNKTSDKSGCIKEFKDNKGNTASSNSLFNGRRKN
jgi:predicted RNase H-like nuclease (RuvC/YqgF family)